MEKYHIRQIYPEHCTNGLLLSFDKDQPSKAPFEFARTKAETDVLETEEEKLVKKGVIAPTNIQPDDYFSNLFTRQNT